MKYISSSQSSKSMAHHNGHNEIPRDYLENICYGNKFVEFCPYKLFIESCPGSCSNYNQQENYSDESESIVGQLEEHTLTKVFAKPPVVNKECTFKYTNLNQVQKFYRRYGEDYIVALKGLSL